jgi:hypothetical protein
MPLKATTTVVAGSVRTYQGPPNLVAGTCVTQGASDGLIALPTAPNQQILGIVEETDLVGRGVYAIVRQGESTAICGAAVVAPAWLKSDGNGNVVPSTAVGDNLVGYALSSTVNALDELVVFVSPSIR